MKRRKTLPLILCEKIVIKTDIRGADLPTTSETEDLQVLTIEIGGDISVVKYAYDYRKSNFVIVDQYDYEIDPKRAFYVIDILEEYFSENLYFPVSMDGPHFILEFYYNDGQNPRSYRFDLLDDDELSRIVRQFLQNYDLFVFDGKKNYDHIEEIIINYHRTIKIENDDGTSYRGIKEKLLVDRETVKISRILEDGTKVDFSCILPDKLENFLEFLENAEVFYYIEDREGELFYDLDDKNFYELRLAYGNKGTITTNGTYDKRNLPYFYNIFVRNLTEILGDAAIPDILDPNVYGKIVRSGSDYIYLSVEFSPDGKSYYYRTDDDSIKVGDKVVVAVGNHGRETIAEVVDIEYFDYESLPFPLEETKVVIKKLENDI